MFVPQRPRRFLEIGEFTKDQLLEQIRLDSEQLAQESFESWILESDGKLRLPVFSSQERMQVFASKVSQDLNMVFGLGCISILLQEVTRRETLDFVDLNPLNEKSWEIGLRRRT